MLKFLSLFIEFNLFFRILVVKVFRICDFEFFIFSFIGRDIEEVGN